MTDTISKDKFFNKILPYSQIKKSNVFGNNIHPQDIDGEVEKSGNFLWMEWKYRPEKNQIKWHRPQVCAIVNRLWYMGNRATQFNIYHRCPEENQRILPEHIVGVEIGRRDKWLESHSDKVRFTREMEVDWRKLMTWFEHWKRRVNESPNSFVTWFRQCGSHKEYDTSYKPY